jgi:hypothetical protein
MDCFMCQIYDLRISILQIHSGISKKIGADKNEGSVYQN